MIEHTNVRKAVNVLKQKVIVIVGPTAVGKTKLSIECAKAFSGEIISGDSMQVYKRLDIGTAKIKREEMEGIPHHLIDIKEPEESFSVAEFQAAVRGKIDEISSRGLVPIIVGGTGLYIQSVLNDYQFLEMPSNEALRNELEEAAKEDKGEKLYQKLTTNDPLSAERIHPNNIRRVIRALEIYYSSGKTMSELQKHQKMEPVYDNVIIGLTMDREKLYSRINQRVDMMLDEGLLDEVIELFNQGIKNVQSVQGIGYKELYDFLEGRSDFEEAIELLKQHSRKYAKRQLTWFRNKMDVTWFDMTDQREQLNKTTEIIDFIAGKLKINSNT